MAATAGRERSIRSSAERGAKSESELVDALAGGDQQALAEVFRRFGGDLHRQARRTVRSDHADDVVQEVIVRLWRDPRAFDPARGSLRAFLMMRCRGRAIEVVRSEEARRNREQRVSAEPHKDVCVEAEVLSALDHQAAWSWLAVLTEGERHSIALAFFGGHTYQEVATLLALPEGTVKSRIRSGLRRLHETLVDKRGAVGATI